MRTAEEYLREAFTEEEIAKDNSIYPDARQRTRVYEAIHNAVSEACHEQREICASAYASCADPNFSTVIEHVIKNAPSPEMK